MRTISKAIDCVMIMLGWVVYWALEIILYPFVRYMKWTDRQAEKQKSKKSGFPDLE